MTDDREIDLTVEVTGTPEEGWEANATGAGVSAWMPHSAQRLRHGDGVGPAAPVRDRRGALGAAGRR